MRDDIRTLAEGQAVDFGTVGGAERIGALVRG
jgi:cold shock CspA family protein